MLRIKLLPYVLIQVDSANSLVHVNRKRILMGELSPSPPRPKQSSLHVLRPRFSFQLFLGIHVLCRTKSQRNHLFVPEGVCSGTKRHVTRRIYFRRDLLSIDGVLERWISVAMEVTRATYRH